MTFERFDLRTIAAQPWKNGAGVTRQIAVAPADAGVADFDWRISVAEVGRDAPFSAFPGVDRCIVLLRGAGMRLKSAGGEVDHRLDEPLAPFSFRGELPLQATLIGGVCSDFNVMTRRGVWRSEVAVHSAGFDVAACDVFVLLCIEGEWGVSGVAEAIASMEGVVRRAHRPHPNPLPKGEGVNPPHARSKTNEASGLSPLPLGEGEGEGCAYEPIHIYPVGHGRILAIRLCHDRPA
ncbi:HutD family protein [soil metagenome]